MPAIDNINRVVSVTDFGKKAGEITFWGTPQENAAKAKIDTDAFNSALNFIQQQSNTGDKYVYSLHIPFGEYHLNNKLYYDGKSYGLTITSDPRARIIWTSDTDCGIQISCGIAVNCRLELPKLSSKAFYNSSRRYQDANAYQIDSRGYYDLDLRKGIGIEISGGSWHTITCDHLEGWETAILINNIYNSADNLNIDINTIDLCEKGLRMQVGGGQRLSSLFAQLNTVFCKYPIFISSWGEFAFNSISITTAAFVNEKNGCVIYAEGSSELDEKQVCKVSNNHISVNAAAAGLHYDTTTSNDQGDDPFVCPFLGGAFWPGQLGANSLTDAINGGQSVAYFGGFNNVIRITPINQYPVLSDMVVNPNDPNVKIPVPAYSYIPKGPNGTVRIRDAGFGNDIRIEGSIASSNSVWPYAGAINPIPLSESAVESSYNGGIGGASYFDKVLSSVKISSLAANTKVSETYYLFHQCIPVNNTDVNRPIKVYPADDNTLNSGVVGIAKINPSVPRCISVNFFANKAITAAGVELQFWVEL